MEADAFSKLTATLFGFFGGVISIFLKPWLELRGREFAHPIKTRHQCWIFLAGFNDPTQSIPIELTSGAWGPRRFEGHWSWHNDADPRNYNVVLEDRGELNDLVARGMAEVNGNRVILTNAGWIEFERIKLEFLNPSTSPIQELITPVPD